MAAASDRPGPLRLPLVVGIDQRMIGTSVDAKLVNAAVEKDSEGRIRVMKRPGLGLQSTDIGVAGTGLGCYYWYYSAVFNHLYTITGDGNLRLDQSSTISTVDITNNAVYWFNLTMGTPSYLYFSNGYAGYTITSAGVFAKIVDANYPAITVPGSAFLDGTLYVMDLQARIWGTSGLNNPTAWSALNLIQAQVEPDQGVAIAKQLIYVVAFKQSSVEFFYDAGSPTGSPLLPVQNAKLPFGCRDARTVQSIDDVLYFVGVNKTLGVAVYRIKQLKIEQISNFSVNRLLEGNQSFASFQAHASGHTYYGISMGSMSLVYDVNVGEWSEWTENTVQVAAGAVINTNFDVGSSSSYPPTGVQYLQSFLNGSKVRNLLSIRYTDVSAYDGSTQPIPTQVVTPNFDGGTASKKVLSKLRFVADSLSAGNLQLRWTDDDYKTFSSFATVDLTQTYPSLTNLGTFRRRAFDLRHSSPTPFRIEAVEAHLLLGTS